MFQIKLSTLSVLLGLAAAVSGLYGAFKPAAFGAAARRLPRHIPVGVALMLLATAWFIYNVSQESLSDFSRWKGLFFLLFAAVGLGSCLFVHDFLAVRGIAVIMLLLAKVMVDTARLADTDWRLVITTLAYVMVVAGMWLTISPWRLRDFIEWATASESRIRFLSGIRLAFAMLLVLLGLTVFRGEPRQSQDAGVRFGSSRPVATAVDCFGSHA